MSGNFSTPYNIVGRNDGVMQKIDNFSEGSKLFLKYRDSGYEFIPRISGPDANQNYMVFAEDRATFAGFYDLTSDSKHISTIAFNYNRSESQLNYYTAAEVADKIEGKILKKVKILDTSGISFAANVVQSTTQKPLWRWFVVFAIVFMVIEIFLQRFL